MSLVSERVPVRQKGKDFWACCPLHHEKTPSFKMDPSTQLWHCFGCGEGGGVFDFIMKLDELSFPESVRKLAERAHIEIQETGSRQGHDSTNRQRLKDACKEAADFYHLQLMRGKGEDADSARKYLASRDLGGDVPNSWGLGFAPGNAQLVHHLSSKGFTPKEMISANLAVAGDGGRLRDRFYRRIMFPIRDISGEVIAFGGRTIMDSGPKYLNSQETPIFHKSKVLFGLDKAKAAMTSSGQAIVTEGYTDVIAMHEAGLTNTVASLGTSLTSSHVRTLSRHAGKSIVYIFDGDEAGQRATERALQFIDQTITPEYGQRMTDIRALCLPDGLDPADYLSKHGPDELKALIDSAEPLVLFGIKRRIARHDTSSAEGRANAVTDALDVLAPIKDSILAKDYARQIAGMLKMREDDIVDALSSLKPPKRYDQQDMAKNEATANPPAPAFAKRTYMSAQARNRIKTERELLGVCAQNPAVAFSLGDRISSISWQDGMNAAIASEMLSSLIEHPAIAPPELIEAIGRKVDGAPSILTKAGSFAGTSAESIATYFCEELQIGDMEEKLASLREKIGSASDDGESASAFQESVELQTQLNEMKKRHVLPDSAI